MYISVDGVVKSAFKIKRAALFVIYSFFQCLYLMLISMSWGHNRSMAECNSDKRVFVCFQGHIMIVVLEALFLK